jgi:predicted nucleotidyltransferase
VVDLIRDNLDAIRALCEKHQVLRLFLVGSATGEGFDPERSDVDFLVVFQPEASGGWDHPFFALREDLIALLGRQVDLIDARAQRNPYLIASLNRTKRMLYAA